MVGQSDSIPSKKSPLSELSQERRDEINAVLYIIENDGDLSVDEMLDIIENPHRPHRHGWGNRFVKDRIGTFSRNIDYAQTQAENITRDIGATGPELVREISDVLLDLNDEDEPVDFVDFFQARMGTFARNLETISTAVRAAK